MKNTLDQCLHLTWTSFSKSMRRRLHNSAAQMACEIEPCSNPNRRSESAIAAPQASFGGHSPFADVIEVAAAYLFYLCSNHPFLDENKRAALGACLVFLRLNGYTPAPDGDDWENLTLAVAAGVLSRDEVTARLWQLVG